MTGLPPALAPWTEPLSVLDPQVALAFGPLIRELDRLVADREPGPAREGVLDGFDGLARRGHPELLLASEWLLADEAPMEFLRRAAEGELLHLAPARRSVRSRGRVAVLTDLGPGQAGAGRLVQLAAFIVLHRRAAVRGSELAIGLLDADPPGEWRTGELRPILRHWLRARRPVEPQPATVADWTATAEAVDEVWLLTGLRLARALPGRRRTICSAESGWSDRGAADVTITVNGVSTALALPPAAESLRVLRGQGLRAEPRPPKAVAPAADLRRPVFTSAARRILCRGGSEHEVVALPVPHAPGEKVTPATYRFGAPVRAAAFLGSRLVALLDGGTTASIQTVGRRLRCLTGDLPALPDGPPPADHLDALFIKGDLLVWARPDGYWILWSSLPDHGWQPWERLVAMTPTASRSFDQPSTATKIGDQDRVCVSWPGGIEYLDAGHRVVFGGRARAVSPDGAAWQVRAAGHTAEVEISVKPGDTVLGLVRGGPRSEYGMVTAAPGGVLVRLVTASGKITTLRRWSGLAGAPSVHPTVPLIVGQDDAGQIVAGDVFTGETLVKV